MSAAIEPVVHLLNLTCLFWLSLLVTKTLLGPTKVVSLWRVSDQRDANHCMEGKIHWQDLVRRNVVGSNFFLGPANYGFLNVQRNAHRELL